MAIRVVEDDVADFRSPEQIAHEERKADLLSRRYTLEDLLYQESPNVEPLLGPYIGRGQRTLIGAHGGHGKSTMSLEMVKAVASGGDFLGAYGPKGGERVVVIDLEQGLSVAQRAAWRAFTGSDTYGKTTRELLSAHGPIKGAENITWCDWPESVNLLAEGPDLEAVEEIIADVRPSLVVVDPIYKLFLGANVNELEVVGGFIRQIDRLRQRYEFAVLLPMHPRKPPSQGGGFTMYDLYGSAAWAWWAEVILLLKRKQECAEMQFAKMRVQDEIAWNARWTLDYELGKGFSRRLETVEAGDATQPTDQRVLALIRDVAPKGLSRRDIAEALSLSEETIKKSTERLMGARDDPTRRDARHFERERGDHGRWLYSWKPDVLDSLSMENPESEKWGEVIE